MKNEQTNENTFYDTQLQDTPFILYTEHLQIYPVVSNRQGKGY